MQARVGAVAARFVERLKYNCLIQTTSQLVPKSTIPPAEKARIMGHAVNRTLARRRIVWFREFQLRVAVSGAIPSEMLGTVKRYLAVCKHAGPGPDSYPEMLKSILC